MCELFRTWRSSTEWLSNIDKCKCYVLVKILQGLFDILQNKNCDV